MKSWFNRLLGGLAVCFLLPAAFAQSPVLDIQVVSPENEYGVAFNPGARQAYASATIGKDSTNTAEYQQVIEFAIIDGGAGYLTAPAVRIVGSDGAGASATAVLTGGIVTSIVVDNKGKGYSSAPTVYIDPPPGAIDIGLRIKGFGGEFNTLVYINGALIFRDKLFAGETSLYWVPVRPGVFNVTAETTDKLGNRAVSNPKRFYVSGTAILSPANNSIIPQGSSVLVTAEGTVAKGFIKSIQFFNTTTPVSSAADLNGLTPYAEDLNSPYTCAYTPPVDTVGDYYITAVAIDNTGAKLSPSSSLKLSTVKSIGSLPTVSLVNPVGGTNLSAGTETKIVADAFDVDGYITRVEFYLNGNLMDTVVNFPYAINWTPTVAGSNKIEVIAYDDKSNAIKSAPVVVSVVAGLPTGEISNPLPGSAPIVQGSYVPVTVRAAGRDGGIQTLASIDLLVDGELTGHLPDDTTEGILTEPFVFIWPARVVVGKHKLSARITDNKGMAITTAEVEVEIIANQAPVVTITNPVNTVPSVTIPLGQAMPINVDARDLDGSIAKVEYYVNGTLIEKPDTTYPYTTVYYAPSVGTYKLHALATDNLGKTTQSETVLVEVVAPVGSSPLVSLSFNDPVVDYNAPSTSNTTTTTTGPAKVEMGSTLLLKANALDTDGTITKIEFFGNGTKLGESTKAPYTLILPLLDYGTLELIAVATDNDGNRSSSEAVMLQVLPSLGVEKLWVKLQSPLPEATYVRGEQIIFSATTNAGTATKPVVDLYLNGSLWYTMKSAPYQYTIGLTMQGRYEVRAVLRDLYATTISQPLYINVIENRLPVVSITKPGTGAVVKSGSSVVFESSAQDPDGLISTVEYFVNGTSIGSSTTSPYRVNWGPGSEGLYKITAIATDSSAERTVSSPVVMLCTTPTVGGSSVGDVVYFSADLPGSPFGQYAMVNSGGKTAVFFGKLPDKTDFKTKVVTPGPVRYFNNLSVDAAGRVTAEDPKQFTAQTSDAGATVNFLDASDKATMTILTAPTAVTSINSGYYTASVEGSANLLLQAIVSADARVGFAIAQNGSADIGFGSLATDGKFTVTTLDKTTIKGKFDFQKGLFTADLTGKVSGKAYGSLANGIAFSDGTLFNLSSRGQIAQGSSMIAGFSVSGSEAKNILVRAIGPSLTQFGVAGASLDPRLDLYNSNGVRIALNTDWAGNPALASAMDVVGAFPLDPASKDAVILTLLKPGTYTAVVSGSPGAALVELYDVDSVTSFSVKRLMNISTRAKVLQGDDTLSAGFMVGGNSSKRLLIRGVGPALAGFGVADTMSNPILVLYRHDGDKQTEVRFNDNWSVGNDIPLVVDATQSVGAFPFNAGSKDAVLLLNLAPGTYSATLRSVEGTGGVAMVEVYEVIPVSAE